MSSVQPPAVATGRPSANTRRVLVVGPHGVTGRAITRTLAAGGGWQVSTASRRPVSAGMPSGDGVIEQVSVDLLEEQTSRQAMADAAAGTTHLVYAAYSHQPSMRAAVEPNVAMLRNVLDGLLAGGAPLQRVVLIGGGKSYGEHLGPYKTPAKESDPRFLGPIFYNEQEDLLADRARRGGFSWTVLRPDVVIGFSLGSPMNLLTAIGVYAALSKDAGVPLRFPGRLGAWSALHQSTDAELLGAAVAWALDSETAANEVFNVLNGDQFRWQHLWADIADVFQMPVAAPQPMSLVEQMAGKEAAWTALVTRLGLRPTPYRQLTSWEFADGVWGADYDMVQSTIKIRQAGFAGCIDSHASFVGHLRRLREARYLP